MRVPVNLFIPMSESFIHYLWQFQYFNSDALRTTTGECITVLKTGMPNTNAGPDFLQAQVKIGDIIWVGSVEIHVQSSGWAEHSHEQDQAYNNVVLHVVWNDNKPVLRSDGSSMPTLELNERVDESLMTRYKQLVNSPWIVPCVEHIHSVPALVTLSMLDKAVTERLQRKANEVLALLERNHHDWEETCYQVLARNFGFHVNCEPFLQLAKSVPYKILMKHADKLAQVESILFGQAGFLDDPSHRDEEYLHILKREYTLLNTKFNLEKGKLLKAQWKFLRLRPANFPTLRIAQLAALVCSQKNIFSAIIEAEQITDLRNIFSVRPSSYWQKHYQFGVPSKEQVFALGETSIQNLIINTVVPLWVAIGQLRDDNRYLDRAMSILQHILPESNKITRACSPMGIPNRSAFDSQALLELHTNFCSRRRCLDCNIGAHVLKPASV